MGRDILGAKVLWERTLAEPSADSARAVVPSGQNPYKMWREAEGGTIVPLLENGFHEAFNMAGVLKLPVVFICQNNQWAISVPRDKQTGSKTLAQKTYAYGFEGDAGKFPHFSCS